MADAPEKKIIIGVDDSGESLYSLEWTLDHLIIPMKGTTTEPSRFKVILFHVKPPATHVLRLAGPEIWSPPLVAGAADVLTRVESDIKRMATSVAKMVTDICERRSFKDFEVETAEGDARDLLCKAVERHKAEMLVLGSHGYGAFKRVILGSVSDYCAHHAHCSVLIVKKPKSSTAH
ncbi:hypothetical protein H6P81_016989 [Aristolochia fimbriata]|uniref:UspA domain-containing protein n=1 Tax=Aristolochia fimbriata TaxID=158543 RepID=A0AAV7DWY1_ARIFI|nr:hypothetical protein H6P81_016989 [Aristolochia fimbriata]